MAVPTDFVNLTDLPESDYDANLAIAVESSDIAELTKKMLLSKLASSLQVSNLHTKREAIEWRSGLRVTDELQLYVKDGVEYLPVSKAVPFTTGSSFDGANWVLGGLAILKNQGNILGWVEPSNVGGDYTDAIKDAIDELPKGSTIYLPHPFSMGVVPVRKGMHFVGMNYADDSQITLIGANAGFLIGGRIKEVSFKDLDSTANGSLTDRQKLVSLSSDADITNITYDNLRAGNCVIGISAAFEAGRKLRNKLVIKNSLVRSTVGVMAGEGYGFHYGTDALNGSSGRVVVYNNDTHNTTRHAFYGTRSGNITQYNNTVHNHRSTITDPIEKALVRPAMLIGRAKNVQSFSNSFYRCYGGCVAVAPELVDTINYDSDNVNIWGDNYIEPQGTVPPYIVGLAQHGGGSLRSVSNNNSTFQMQNNAIPTASIYRGFNVGLNNCDINYRGVTSPTNIYVLSPTNETVGSAVNSNGWSVGNNITLENCGSNMTLYRFNNNSGVRMDLNDTVIGKLQAVISTSVALSAANVYMMKNPPEPNSGLKPKQYEQPSAQKPWYENSSQVSTPVGNVTPSYLGQEVFMSTTEKFWKAYGLTNQDWSQLTN